MIAPDGSVSTIDDDAAGHIQALAVESDGSLLISRGGRIWRRSPDGATSLIAGDGSLRIPALTVGDDGFIFYAVIETSLTVIRRVDGRGVSTVFQDRPGLLGGALSNHIQGIAAAPDGAIYVADYVFDRVIVSPLTRQPENVDVIAAQVGVARFEVSIAVTPD